MEKISNNHGVGQKKTIKYGNFMNYVPFFSMIIGAKIGKNKKEKNNYNFKYFVCLRCFFLLNESYLFLLNLAGPQRLFN